MDVTLTCDCGQSRTVSEGSAGATLRCRCGESIQVPSLAELRVLAGKTPIEIAPEVLIEEALATGELPGTTCVRCGGQSEGVAHYIAVCESSFVRNPNTTTAGLPTEFVRKLCSSLIPFGGLMLRMQEDQDDRSLLGRETIVPVPLPLCHLCEADAVPWDYSPLIFALAWMVSIPSIITAYVNERHFWTSVGMSLCLFLWASWTASSAHFRSRELFHKIPLYRDLLTRFPDAEIVKVRQTNS